MWFKTNIVKFITKINVKAVTTLNKEIVHVSLTNKLVYNG